MRLSQKLLAIVVLGCLAALTALGAWAWLNANDWHMHNVTRSVEEGRWSDKSEAEILQRFGQPTYVENKYVPIGNEDLPALPPGPCKTFTYKGRSGYLVVWMNLHGSDYYCFDSLWFDNNVAF